MSEDDPLKHLEILRPLGQGRRGRISLAEETQGGREGQRVALFQCAPSFARSHGRLERFEESTLRWRRASHPGIVALHSAGVDGEIPFLVMEFVDGPSLDQVLRLCNRRGILLPLGLALSIWQSLAEALAFVHEDDRTTTTSFSGHGALRPTTVLLSEDGRVRLSKPWFAHWMRAEQADDSQGDLQKLGRIAYPLVCGHPPEGSAPTPPRALRGDVDDALETLLLRNLSGAWDELSGDSRSAAGLAEELEGYISARTDLETSSEALTAFLASIRRQPEPPTSPADNSGEPLLGRVLEADTPSWDALSRSQPAEAIDLAGALDDLVPNEWDANLDSEEDITQALYEEQEDAAQAPQVLGPAGVLTPAIKLGHDGTSLSESEGEDDIEFPESDWGPGQLRSRLLWAAGAISVPLLLLELGRALS